jgi:hypothetical protein
MPPERWLLRQHADRLTIAHAYPDKLNGARIKAAHPDDVKCDKCVISFEAIMLAEATIIVINICVERGCMCWYIDRQGSELPQRHVFDGLRTHWEIYPDPMLAAKKWLRLAGRLPAKVSLQKNWTLTGGPYRPLAVQEIEFRRAKFNYTEEAWARGWRVICDINSTRRFFWENPTKVVSLEEVAYLLPPAEMVRRLYKALR